MKQLVILTLCLGQVMAQAQEKSKMEMDRAAILAMAGAYNVNFHFKETAGFQPGYELTPAYDSKALEWVVVVEESDHKIVLQHLLQTSRGIVKHWRQDWEFESTVLWEFQGGKHWIKKEYHPEKVKGTWTQRVFQVDDSPRYEAFGHWVHVGDLSQWESMPTNRPLPRREYTKRSDYEILLAVNRHAITPTGWVHEQDNSKLHKTEDGEEKMIAREFGLNTYDYVRETQVRETMDWWKANRVVWADVRQVWDRFFSDHQTLTFRKDLDGKPLYRHLFKLAGEAAESEDYEPDAFKGRIAEVIESFMITQKQASLDSGY